MEVGEEEHEEKKRQAFLHMRSLWHLYSAILATYDFHLFSFSRFVSFEITWRGFVRVPADIALLVTFSAMKMIEAINFAECLVFRCMIV